jgi:hypothetical protein
MEKGVGEARWILVPLFCFYVVVMAAGIFLTWSEQQKENREQWISPSSPIRMNADLREASHRHRVASRPA